MHYTLQYSTTTYKNNNNVDFKCKGLDSLLLERPSRHSFRGDEICSYHFDLCSLRCLSFLLHLPSIIPNLTISDYTPNFPLDSNIDQRLFGLVQLNWLSAPLVLGDFIAYEQPKITHVQSAHSHSGFGCRIVLLRRLALIRELGRTDCRESGVENNLIGGLTIMDIPPRTFLQDSKKSFTFSGHLEKLFLFLFCSRKFPTVQNYLLYVHIVC